MLSTQRVHALLSTTPGAYISGGSQVHFRLVSGLHSTEYIHLRIALQDPQVLDEFARSIVNQTRDLAFDAVVSFTKGGALLAQQVAALVAAQHVCGSRRKVGTDQSITFPPSELGKLECGAPILLLDEVLTTGGSIRQAIRVLEKATLCKVVAVAIGWDRSESTPTFADGSGRRIPIFSAVKRPVKTYHQV
jgi:orotate phosphoribosyltransferase